MKRIVKIALMILMVFSISGCTVVRIATNNIDTIVDVILSKDNKLYNTIGKGYKYYKPRGVSNFDTTEFNERLLFGGSNTTRI